LAIGLFPSLGFLGINTQPSLSVLLNKSLLAFPLPLLCSQG